ncbi:MAG TPA: YHYH protein [Chthoniobacteraceae bacterium]
MISPHLPAQTTPAGRRVHEFLLRALAIGLLAEAFALSCYAHPGDGGAPESVTPSFFLAQAGPPPRRATNSPDESGSTSAKNEVSITIEGDSRVIRSNGIPDHSPGQFPNRYNPNTIAPQHYNYRVPVHPAVAAEATRLRMQPFGIALNGVVFDPSAAEWWRGDRHWQYEPMRLEGKLGLDQNNAHVQPDGAYHYHAIPVALLQRLSGGKPGVVLIGWAADGFPIYGPWGHADPKNPASPLKQLKTSYRVKSGNRPSGPGGAYDGLYLQDYEYVAGSGDLDECNGRTGPTPEFPEGTYHYVLTENWPFIPRAYHGTPDHSFERREPPGGFGPPGFGPPGGGPRRFPPGPPP